TPGQAAVRSQQSSASIQNGVLPPEGVPGALTNQPPANPVAPIEVQPAANPQGQANQANPPNQANPQANANQANAAQDTAPTGTSRNDATINYEVDRTISHVKDPVGTLRRLSVAVVVNYRMV